MSSLASTSEGRGGGVRCQGARAGGQLAWRRGHAPSWRVTTTSFWRVACSSTLLDMRLYSVSTCSPRCACVLCACATRPNYKTSAPVSLLPRGRHSSPAGDALTCTHLLSRAVQAVRLQGRGGVSQGQGLLQRLRTLPLHSRRVTRVPRLRPGRLQRIQCRLQQRLGDARGAGSGRLGAGVWGAQQLAPGATTTPHLQLLVLGQHGRLMHFRMERHGWRRSVAGPQDRGCARRRSGFSEEGPGARALAPGAPH
jgi:hypothetical protein